MYLPTDEIPTVEVHTEYNDVTISLVKNDIRCGASDRLGEYLSDAIHGVFVGEPIGARTVHAIESTVKQLLYDLTKVERLVLDETQDPVCYGMTELHMPSIDYEDIYKTVAVVGCDHF